MTISLIVFAVFVFIITVVLLVDNKLSNTSETVILISLLILVVSFAYNLEEHDKYKKQYVKLAHE